MRVAFDKEGCGAAVSPSETSAVESRWTAIRGGRIHYRTNSAPGDGPVVFLIHGLVVSSTYLVPTAERLAPFCRVYAPDLPGYGKSYKPENVLSLAELADALSEIMDALGIAKAHLVGNSFGCQIIAEFALRHENRVARLVLQGPTVDPSARSLGKQLLRLIINSPRERRSMGPIMFRDYRAAGLHRIVGTIRLSLEDRLEEKLPQILAPTLVVRGEKDPVVPQAWAERVTALLPHGRLAVIPGAAHTIVYSTADEFAGVIRRFLGLR